MNVRIFWVRAMKCMCAQTRPRFILSSEGVFGGMEFKPMLTPREKSPLLENVPRGGSNPRHHGQRAQALPTELFWPPWWGVSSVWQMIVCGVRVCDGGVFCKTGDWMWGSCVLWRCLLYDRWLYVGFVLAMGVSSEWQVILCGVRVCDGGVFCMTGDCMLSVSFCSTGASSVGGMCLLCLFCTMAVSSVWQLLLLTASVS